MIRHKRKDGTVEIKFYFVFENGHKGNMLVEDAYKYAAENETKFVKNGYKDFQLAQRTKRRVKDGFQAGFTYQGEVITGKKHWEKVKNKHGLVEMGNEFKPMDYAGEKGLKFDDADIKKAHELGVNLSENEWKGVNETNGEVD